MRIRLIGLTILGALVAGAAQAGAVAVDPATGAERPVNWKWTQAPDALRLGLFLNAVASSSARRGDTGRVECVIDETRHPAHCHVLSETPGSAMGRAALGAAGGYRAAATDDDGKPTVGRAVRLSFVLPPRGVVE
jgi:hypothetical protein